MAARRARGEPVGEMTGLVAAGQTEESKMDAKDRRARGLAVYQAMGWGENAAVKELDEDLRQITTDVLFGEIWSRPGLSLRERELVTLAALMAAKADGIALHMRNAHNL